MSPDHEQVRATNSPRREGRRTFTKINNHYNNNKMMCVIRSCWIVLPEGAAIERPGNCRAGSIDESRGCCCHSLETWAMHSRLLRLEDDGCRREPDAAKKQARRIAIRQTSSWYTFFGPSVVIPRRDHSGPAKKCLRSSRTRKHPSSNCPLSTWHGQLRQLGPRSDGRSKRHVRLL